jgi:hypothetical protein
VHQVSCESPISAIPHITENALKESKQSKWTALVKQFGAGRVAQHEWDWEDGDFLPVYEYQHVSCITDVWVEWATGLNGFIPVRELMEKWGPKWRRNILGERQRVHVARLS